GWLSDCVIFDAAEVAPAEVEVREDLPGGACRLYSEAVGVHHVFINGEHAVRNGEFTDARPGALLRSGRDTERVSATA
ncbi:MAG: aminoacylase, partial [Actinomycetota bacterium]|nr:aminoacylase [Actinomycetota bacterium]